MTHLRMQLRTLAFGAAAATALAAATMACSTKGAMPDTTTAAATGAPATTASASSTTEPTPEQISEYPLDMDKLRKLERTMDAMNAAAERDPRVADALATQADETAVQTIAKYDRNATMRGILADVGWTSRDYVLTAAALMQASMLLATLEATPGATMPAGYSTRNVEFMKAHRKEVESLGSASSGGR